MLLGICGTVFSVLLFGFRSLPLSLPLLLSLSPSSIVLSLDAHT